MSSRARYAYIDRLRTIRIQCSRCRRPAVVKKWTRVCDTCRRELEEL